MKAHGHFVYSTECLNMEPEVLETRQRDHEQGLRGCKKGVQRKVENSIKGETLPATSICLEHLLTNVVWTYDIFEKNLGVSN